MPYAGYATWNYGEQVNARPARLHPPGQSVPDALRRERGVRRDPALADRRRAAARRARASRSAAASLARDADGNRARRDPPRADRAPGGELPVDGLRAELPALGGTTVPFTEVQLAAAPIRPTPTTRARCARPPIRTSRTAFCSRRTRGSLLSRVDGAVNRWPTAPGVADCDDDGIPDDVDNRPLVANTDQADDGGVNTHTPDGIGNACQCGDVTGQRDRERPGRERDQAPRPRPGAEPDLSRARQLRRDGQRTVQRPGRATPCARRRSGRSAAAVDVRARTARTPTRTRRTCTNCGESGNGTTWRIEDVPERAGAGAQRVLLGDVGRHDRSSARARSSSTPRCVAAGDTGLPRTASRSAARARARRSSTSSSSDSPEGLSFSHMDGHHDREL